MRISDWSSDVYSSDLAPPTLRRPLRARAALPALALARERVSARAPHHASNDQSTAPRRAQQRPAGRYPRGEARPGSFAVSLRTDADDAHHPRVHVIEKVAMERPVAERVGCEIKARSPARLAEPRMLARRAVALPRHQLEQMAVQVDRMAHHRIVDEVDPYPLALDEGNGLEIGRAHV